MVVILAPLLSITGPYAKCRAHEIAPSLTPVRVFEGGTAYRTSDDCYWVLRLSGSWRQMGRQYGGLVRDGLRQFYAEITTDVKERGIDIDEQLENARFWALTFSPNLNELMRGIAESSGLSEDEALVLNAGMSSPSHAILQGEAPSACSGLAVWGRYTPDGALVRKAGQEGLPASYNSFVPPYPDEWNNRVADPPEEADDPRYNNLINLANSPGFCGRLDVGNMKKLMDIDVRNGGAVHRGTVYQVIALP